MSSARTAAKDFLAKPRTEVDEHYDVPAEAFGEYVFNEAKMRIKLPGNVYKNVLNFLKGTEPSISEKDADTFANALKEWAIELGCTHFTHWFQPLTGLTAEKHDSFLDMDRKSGNRPLMELSGELLIRGEPDASSFPSGGRRETHEARGYTSWDPSTPAFIKKTPQGGTLCIPTVFTSWTGEALDMKTPMKRSDDALSKATVHLLRVLGDSESTMAYSTLGPEQEYFLVDRVFANQREDIVLTGRTVQGALPGKRQELCDHYFGPLNPRIQKVMEEFEAELWKLGIPVRTRHNEVAPGQHEVAPVFDRASVASDHNMLQMDVMRTIASKHGFHCLFHEKPFAGLNGTGKHNNWSIATDTGKNLLSPGKDPRNNAEFIAFCTAVIAAVDEYADLLRCSIANSGNDHRLGANEAPPAIISVFLGAEVDTLVRDVAGSALTTDAPKPQLISQRTMKFTAKDLVSFHRDTGDRNRTSPFAFTGNRFEFRAVGSSQNCSTPVAVLNTAVADKVELVATLLEEKLKSHQGTLNEAVDEVCREVIAQHYRVVFNGDGYSAEWVKKAESLGLPNLKDTPRALARWMDEKNVALFEKWNVLSKAEMEDRRNVWLEKYAAEVTIEARVLSNMTRTQVLPAALKHQTTLAASIAALKGAGVEVPVEQTEALKELSTKIASMMKLLDALDEAIAEVAEEDDLIDRAAAAADQIKATADNLRTVCDSLEEQIDDSLWPMPKYSEMLFIK